MNALRYVLVGLGLLAVLGLFGQQVSSLEALKSDGRTVLLDLRPADPRAFMQGDYMTLAYAEERRVEERDSLPPSGQVILKIDKNNVGSFVRIDDGSALSADEARLNFVKKRFGPSFGSTRYYFQEGTAETFDAARFGVFKVSPEGRAVLVALADENYKILKAD